MKFRLKSVHLFLALLAVLLLSHLGMNLKEFFENKDDSDKAAAATSATSTHSTSQGVSSSQIPPGNEHLYILKSEIVPPVCPKCPDVQLCNKNKKCPPCPACARCPQPAFTCKKVPNYSAANDEYLPRPILNDFSQFGM